MNAELASGVDLVMELANFDEVLEGANWVITGEGQLDGQTFSGKTINGVVQCSKNKMFPLRPSVVPLMLPLMKCNEWDWIIPFPFSIK